MHNNVSLQPFEYKLIRMANYVRTFKLKSRILNENGDLGKICKLPYLESSNE